MAGSSASAGHKFFGNYKLFAEKLDNAIHETERMVEDFKCNRALTAEQQAIKDFVEELHTTIRQLEQYCERAVPGYVPPSDARGSFFSIQDDASVNATSDSFKTRLHTQRSIHIMKEFLVNELTRSETKETEIKKKVKRNH
jgi:hypothetical protein